MRKEKHEPLRVLHLILSLGVGGAEKLVYDMSLACDPSKITASACCLNIVGPLGEDLIRRGYKVHYLKRSPGLDISLIRRIRRLIIEERIDVIHAHQYTPLFYGALAAFSVKNTRIIMTEHGRLFPDKKNWKRCLFNPFLTAMTNKLISISERTKTAMMKNDNFPGYKIKVIYNGVKQLADKQRIDPEAKKTLLGLRKDWKVVGTAARLDEIKNFPMMLRSFKGVLENEPDSCLLIAGKGPKEAELKKLASELNISERVFFLGLRMDLDEIYQVYDVFVLTSLTEGISITVLEAMSAGLPTVVTDVGGNPEIVVNEKTGYLVPLGDEKKMAQRIIELLRDPQQRGDMGERGKARVKECFSFDRMLESYLDLYYSC